MNTMLFYICVAVYAIFLNSGWCHGEETKPPKTPSLSEIIFSGMGSIKELDPSHYPKERRPCLQNYLAAIAPDSFLWTFEPPSNPEKVVFVRKALLAEQMFIILGQHVRAEAETFAKIMPLMSEWEGMSEGPLGEADFVDDWLRERPSTPIAPFLYLLKAHRLKAAYEAARVRNEKNLWPVLSRRYREALNMAISSPNPLISCIADDLDAQSFMYLEGQERP